MNNRILMMVGAALMLGGLLRADHQPVTPSKSVKKSTSTIKSGVKSTPKASTPYVIRPSSQTVKRREAVLALGDSQDSNTAGPKLVAALADKDPMTRSLAAQGIGTTKYVPGLERLGQVLISDPAAEVREAAAVALKQLGDRRAVPVLAKGLNDSVANVKITVLLGLAYYREPSVRMQVEDATRDASPEVRRAALYALGRFEDPQSAPAVEALIKDSDPTVRAVAAQTLSEIRATNAKPALMGLLQDPDKAVQVSAARSLLKMGDSAGFEKAKAYATDPDLAVRLLAIDALGWSTDREAKSILEDLKKKVPADSQMAIEEALRRHEALRKKR